MRTIYFFIAMLIVYSCSNNKADGNVVEDNNDSGLQLDKSLVDGFSRSDYFDPSNPEHTFKAVAEYTVDLNNNGKLDTIQLFNIVGWESDPGEFRLIRISMDNGSRWQETNFEGWVKFNENYPVPSHIVGKNQLESDLLLLTEFNNSKVLGLFGWVYASIPGFLTFLEFSSGNPSILINKKLELVDLTPTKIVTSDYSQQCSIEIVRNTVIKKCE